MSSHNPREWHWPEGIPESLANTKARMAIKTLNIRKNADNTLTISANNYRESISIEGKTDQELYEACKYAIICASFDWNDEVSTLVSTELAKIR